MTKLLSKNKQKQNEITKKVHCRMQNNEYEKTTLEGIQLINLKYLRIEINSLAWHYVVAEIVKEVLVVWVDGSNHAVVKIYENYLVLAVT